MTNISAVDVYAIAPEKHAFERQYLDSAHTEIWQSDSMEPVIDFGDDIRIVPTGGRIRRNGIYMFHLPNHHVQPAAARRLCAPVVKAIWYVSRLSNGFVSLRCANPAYREMNSDMLESELLSRWIVAGRVLMENRLGRGFRNMGVGAAQGERSIVHLHGDSFLRGGRNV